MNLTDVSIRNPVFAWMLMASTLLFGLIAAMRIGVSQYPDVDYPNITVSLSWPGASPAAVEREVIEPLEQALSQVEGVQQMSSQARKGSARITLAFDVSRNVDLALQDVQAKVARSQRQLPVDVPAATVSKANPDDTPILTVGVSGPFSRQRLADVARYQVQERLQTVPGVGQISLSGYVNRNLRVWIDASRMAEKNVAINEVLAAIRRDHIELPGGQLEAGGRQINVRLLGEALDLDTFRGIVVRRDGEARVRLSDVALVEDGFEDKSSIAQLDGLPFQALGVLKQRGTNAVSVARAVRERVADIQRDLPAGMKIDVLFDSTTFIEESVHEIEIELGLALLLTALVCWLFLGSLSSTFNVLLAIPMSLLGTVGVIYFLGFTLNTFTLLGLSLAVGLVVDDAVMVLENIHRHAEMGKDRRRAAAEGTHEITFAALAATLAVVAIFLPVVFMGGVVGKFFFQFGVTLSVAVLLSYLEAITLAPARCAQLLSVGKHERGWVGRQADRGFEALERGYAWALGRGAGARAGAPVEGAGWGGGGDRAGRVGGDDAPRRVCPCPGPEHAARQAPGCPRHQPGCRDPSRRARRALGPIPARGGAHADHAGRSLRDDDLAPGAARQAGRDRPGIRRARPAAALRHRGPHDRRRGPFQARFWRRAGGPHRPHAPRP